MTVAEVIEKELTELNSGSGLLILDQLLAQDSSANHVVISNPMASEMEASVFASVIRKDDIKGLYLVSADENGKKVLMRDDYLPFVGRCFCRLAHRMGYKIYLALPNPCRQPEAVIVTPEGVFIQLLPGEKRQRKQNKIDADSAREETNEEVAVISTSKRN